MTTATAASHTDACGPHCGVITDPLSGFPIAKHCDCAELCHDGGAAALTEIQSGAAVRTGQPMCARWYEGVMVMPWTGHLSTCICAVSAQALPRQHGSHCPVYRYWLRTQDPADPAYDHDDRHAWPAH